MLLGDFYTITKPAVLGNTIRAEIRLNPAHPVFAGHFPGQPLVPGVCMMEMVKEIFEHTMGSPCRIVQSDIAKFLSMIDPRRQVLFDALIQYEPAAGNSFDISASLFDEATVFFKWKARLVQA